MSDSKKKFSFFKEQEEVDPAQDGGKLLGTWRKRSEFDHAYDLNWQDIDRRVYGDGGPNDVFTFIYGDDYYQDDDDNVSITYTKNDRSDMFSSLREDYPDYFIDRRLECKMTEDMGRGVFATEDIPKDILIESAPVILCHSNLFHEIVTIHGKVILSEYPFGWGKNGLMAIAMGWGGIYNHQARPNAIWRPNYDLESIEYRTARDIKKGEQIFIRYLPIWALENLWFEDEESEKIVEDRENMEWHEDPSTLASWRMFKPGKRKPSDGNQ